MSFCEAIDAIFNRYGLGNAPVKHLPGGFDRVEGAGLVRDCGIRTNCESFAAERELLCQVNRVGLDGEVVRSGGGSEVIGFGLSFWHLAIRVCA